MAINKITAPLSTGPSVFAAPVINQLAALLTDCNHGTRVSGGYVKAGSLWNIGGTMFLADSDTAITGTRSSSTTGIKFTVSGSTATASYGTDTPTWNAAHQGYYDTDGNYYYRGVGPGSYLAYPNRIGTQVANFTGAVTGVYKCEKTGLYTIKFVITQTGGTIYGQNAVIQLNDSDDDYGTAHTFTDTGASENLFFEEGDLVKVFSSGSGVVWFDAFILNDSYGKLLS